MVAAKKPSLQALGLAHAENKGETCTPVLTAADAIAVGQTLRALSRTAPASAAERMLRVGAQLVSAGELAKAGAK